MKIYLKLAPYIIIIILVIIIFFKGCGNDKEKKPVIVTFPEISGSFDIQDPTYIPSKERSVIELEGKKVELKNPVNDSLLKAFRRVLFERDSLQAILMYADLVQYRKFSNVFEDENIKITTDGEVLGYLQWIKPKYTIKERSTEIDIKETYLRILGGFEVGSNETISSFPLKVNIGFQNRKGNIFNASFMKLGDENYYLAGYNFSILNLKR